LCWPNMATLNNGKNHCVFFNKSIYINLKICFRYFVPEV
jgi:hypothetical protein